MGTEPLVGNVRLQALRLNYIAPIERHLRAFWSWWVGELMPLLPPRLQSVLSQREQSAFIECEGETFVVRQGTTSGDTELARISPTEGRSGTTRLSDSVRDCVLLLPPEMVLHKSMTLPLATEENLREVLSFEMDRQTPFCVDQVYYDHLVTSRNAGQKTLSVDLVVAPREMVDELLERLASRALRADIVATRDVNGTAILPINLLPRRSRSHAIKRLSRLNAAIAVIAAALFVTAISLPILQKRQAVRELEPQLAEAISQAKSANELRREVERLVAGSTYLVEKKRSGSSVMRTINELTRALPDHTWIHRLDISETVAQLQGQSSSSASLISLLESSPTFERVRFRSPVTRVPNTSDERFHLSADIEGEQAQ